RRRDGDRRPKKSCRPAGDDVQQLRAGRPTLREGVRDLAPTTGVAAACRALGVARSSYYRWRGLASGSDGTSSVVSGSAGPALRPSPRALTSEEQEAVREQLHSERFINTAPAEVVATLLDEGVYLASERTRYRLLRQEGESGERRCQLTHPAYHKPELLA